MPRAKRISGGNHRTGPATTNYRLPSQRRDVADLAYRDAPYPRCDWMQDFEGRSNALVILVPLFLTSGNADIAKTPVTNTQVSRGYLYVPRGGVITNVDFVGEDGVTQDGTNFLTFTGLNKLAAGVGAISFLDTTAHVNTTDTNAAALNGGTNLTAKQPYPLALSAVAAATRVSGGDILELTATASGTGALVDAPVVRVRISCLPEDVTTQAQRTAGQPLVASVANTANGEILLQLDATSEAQGAFVTWGDQLVIPGNRRPRFEALVKVAAMAAAQTVVIGLCSAFNNTLSSTTFNLWFRLSASLAVTIEGDDNATDTDLQASSPSVTLTAGTYALFTIDASDLTSVNFFVDETYIGSVNVAAMSATSLMQPVIGCQKSTGVTTPSVTIDFMRVSWDRF